MPLAEGGKKKYRRVWKNLDDHMTSMLQLGGWDANDKMQYLLTFH